ncbi:flagellar hook-length control protein FliK [Ferrimonas sp.]|uniref:flagellar hook-length control protein FliK n=1 Tax=Ferrimonas sp. TaxID=2080861 RepID=UPI003A8FF931
MEARLQVTQTPSVLSTAPASKGSSDDGFEAALANATDASQGKEAQHQAIEGKKTELSEASKTGVEPAKADDRTDSSKSNSPGDAQPKLKTDEQALEGEGGESGEPTSLPPLEGAPDAAESTDAKTPELQEAVLPKVATQTEPERQQSAPGKSREDTDSAAEAGSQATLTTAAETDTVATKISQEGEQAKQPLDKVDPVKGAPSADSEYPKPDTPGLKVAGEAKLRRGPSERGQESRAEATSATPRAQQALAESKSEGQQSQGKTDASPFAVLNQPGGEGETLDGQGEAGAEASDSPKVVAKLDLKETPPAPGGVKAEPHAAAEGKASSQTDAKEGPKTLSGSELLTQLQGSREVQTKLDGEPLPQKLDAASRQAMGDTTAMAQAPATQKLSGERLDPELAKEVSALQGTQAKAEPGLRSAQVTAEMTLATQTQLPEAAPLAASAEHGEGVELDTAHRMQHGRTPEAGRPAQVEAQQAAMRQPVAAERMAPELRERMMMMINSRTSQAEIRLDPPELGALQIKIQMNGDQAQVQLHTQQAQTREMVEQALPRLREMLAQQGITLADTQVSHGGSGQAGTQEGEAGADGLAMGGDGMVEASDEALVTVQQMTGRNADGGIDYYA